MSTLRRFACQDLFRFNSVNLDYFTETVVIRSRCITALLSGTASWRSVAVARLCADAFWWLLCAVQPVLLPSVLGAVARVLPAGRWARPAKHRLRQVLPAALPPPGHSPPHEAQPHVLPGVLTSCLVCCSDRQGRGGRPQVAWPCDGSHHCTCVPAAAPGGKANVHVGGRYRQHVSVVQCVLYLLANGSSIYRLLQ